MIVKEIIQGLELLAPVKLAESYDNVGLLVGKSDKEVSRIMVALDASESVIDECIARKVDLLITHHPIIFSPVKRITADHASGRKLLKLMQNQIACYAIHTNFDVAVMAKEAASRLGLKNPRVLSETYQESLVKLVVFIPVDSAEKVRVAMAKEGAGFIGNYSECSFGVQGLGSFKPLEGTSPYIGKLNEVTHTQEVRLETVVRRDKLQAVLKAMVRVHPYEEVAYDIYKLENEFNIAGIGYYGYLNQDMSLKDLAVYVKGIFNLGSVSVVGDLSRKVASIAISPGSGKSMVADALRAKTDVLITGDIDHHTALDAKEAGLCIIDAGHYGTEYLFVDVMRRYIHNYLYQSDINYVGVPEVVEILAATESNPFITI